MGLIKPIDVTIVKDREYDVLTALAVNGEYIEEIGEACENPAGYTQGSIFLARNDVVMHLYKATANITAGQAMTIGTNCELSSLDAMFKKSGQDLDSVKQALSDEVSARATLGAHNLFNPFSNFKASPTRTSTINSDGSITVSAGTTTSNWFYPNESYKTEDVEIPYKPNTKYVFSIGSETASLNVAYKETASSDWTYLVNQSGLSEAEFTMPATFYDVLVRIWIPSGTITQKTFYPMVCDAKDAYTGYLPYVPTNAECLSADANAELGAHQFLDYDLADIKANNTTGTWTGNVYTINNLTVTVNSDLSIGVSGNASQTTVILFGTAKLKSGVSYTISGCPNGGSDNYYYDGLYKVGVIDVKEYGDGLVYVPSSDTTCQFRLVIKAGAGTLLFKPLVKLASDPSTKFTPYAMTNQQLTDAVVKSSINPNSYKSADVTSAQGNVIKMGNLVMGYVIWSGAVTSNNAIITLPEGYRPSALVTAAHIIKRASDFIVNGSCGITTAGVIYDGTTSSEKTGGTIIFAFVI